MDLLRFFPVDERLLVKKYIFWTYLHFFKEHNLKKNGGIIWKKEHNDSIIWPKKAMLLA